MIRKAVVALTLSCGFFATATATDRSLENQLASQYGDKVLALRHSFKSDSQEYEADGAPAKAGEEGSWTLYGRILVKKITVGVDRLRVEGKRALYSFDKSGNPVQFPDDRKNPAKNLKITVRLKQPLSSADEAAAILGRVFALTPEEIVNSAPAYWQSYLAAQMAATQDSKKGATQSGDVAQTQPSGWTGEAPKEGQRIIHLPKGAFGKDDTVDGEKVFQLGQGVTWPKSLYNPEPEFTDAARAAAFQGKVGMTLVVDSTGRVKNVRLIHPLGMGLDENAVNTVSTWRFTPATRDGKPVAVALYVEVDFHLGR
jgi:TonB family protein